jgi:diaminohydroxyphosphoribosylaminopyrimidine deaminase/5-amino-6-(5-phosphoribosylamino)uracil reductase
VKHPISNGTIYNKIMSDPQQESITLASLGLGKIFDVPYVGVIAIGEHDSSWYEGNGIPFHTWMTTLVFRSIKTFIFSYEVSKEWFNGLVFPSSIRFEFCSPNALLPGLTANFLKEQGYEVQLQSLPLAMELNHVWYDNPRTDIPFIAQSFGMSLDGKIATRTGDSKYISGKEVLEAVHRLRHRYQAILVGINTVLLDHPQLTTRLKDGQGHSPIRIILDTHLRMSMDEPLLNNQESSTWIVTQLDADQSKVNAFKNKGAKIIQVSLMGEHLNLEVVLKNLKHHGIHSVLVEGGATIHGAFLDHGFTHRVYASISPLLIGGQEAKTPIAGQGFQTLKDSLRLAFIHMETFGEDLFLTATIKGKNV